MVTEGSDTVARRNEGIVSALCKHLSGLSLDPKSFSRGSDGHDILSLFSKVLQESRNGVSLKNKDEIMKWVTFANNFPSEVEACHSALMGLNEDLTKSTVLLGDGLKPSEADVVVFSAVHSFVSRLSSSDMQKFPNVMRWMDYIQNKEDFGGAFEKSPIIFEKTRFEPHLCIQNTDELEVDPKSKKATHGMKTTENSDTNLSKCHAEKKKGSGGGKVVEEKRKISDKEDMEVSITVLNIQVGVIRKAWKHPSADSLLVEEIDLGGGNIRQVVSGLAKFCTPDDLTNRGVVLITNVRPGKLRDVMSAGLVLCASNEDHTVVEPLLPPEGAIPGEHISFPGHEGKPEDVLNPKKKQLDKITPHLYTDGMGVATYKGIPFMTSLGPCTSSISNGSIK